MFMFYFVVATDSEKKDEDEKKLSEARDEEEGWSKLEFKEEKHAPSKFCYNTERQYQIRETSILHFVTMR